MLLSSQSPDVRNPYSVSNGPDPEEGPQEGPFPRGASIVTCVCTAEDLRSVFPRSRECPVHPSLRTLAARCLHPASCKLGRVAVLGYDSDDGFVDGCRPATRELPFELESHDEFMAKVRTGTTGTNLGEDQRFPAESVTIFAVPLHGSDILVEAPPGSTAVAIHDKLEKALLQSRPVSVNIAGAFLQVPTALGEAPLGSITVVEHSELLPSSDDAEIHDLPDYPGTWGDDRWVAKNFRRLSPAEIRRFLLEEPCSDSESDGSYKPPDTRSSASSRSPSPPGMSPLRDLPSDPAGTGGMNQASPTRIHSPSVRRPDPRTASSTKPQPPLSAGQGFPINPSLAKWTSLLHDHPESIKELLFRLPWYRHQGFARSKSSEWEFRVVSKSVPLNLTWLEVALALNASTPMDMGASFFLLSSRILRPNDTVRGSRVPAYSTIHARARLPGGADSDSDSDSDSDHEDQEGSSLLIEGSSSEAPPTETGWIQSAIDVVTSPFGIRNPNTSVDNERIEFSPAVRSATSSPLHDVSLRSSQQQKDDLDQGFSYLQGSVSSAKIGEINGKTLTKKSDDNDYFSLGDRRNSVVYGPQTRAEFEDSNGFTREVHVSRGSVTTPPVGEVRYWSSSVQTAERGPFSGTAEDVPNPDGGPPKLRRTTIDMVIGLHGVKEVILHPLGTTVSVTKGGEVALHEEKDDVPDKIVPEEVANRFACPNTYEESDSDGCDSDDSETSIGRIIQGAERDRRDAERGLQRDQDVHFDHQIGGTHDTPDDPSTLRPSTALWDKLVEGNALLQMVAAGAPRLTDDEFRARFPVDPTLMFNDALEAALPTVHDDGAGGYSATRNALPHDDLIPTPRVIRVEPPVIRPDEFSSSTQHFGNPTRAPESPAVRNDSAPTARSGRSQSRKKDHAKSPNHPWWELEARERSNGKTPLPTVIRGPEPPPGSVVINGVTMVPQFQERDPYHSAAELPPRFSGEPTESVRRVSRRSRPRKRDSEYAQRFPRSPANPKGNSGQGSSGQDPSSGNGNSGNGPAGGLRGGAYRRRGGSYTAGSPPPTDWNSPRNPPPPPPPASGHRAEGYSYYQKLRQTFKLEPFSGLAKDWEAFERSLERYATIHGLGAVLEEDYRSSPTFNFEQNQLFYYALQEAVSGAPQALSFFKQAAKWDGHDAYIHVHRAYHFMGPTTAALLLKKLTTLRFLPSETATAFVLRLVELFDQMEGVPGDAAYAFNDVQKIGYLLSGIAHEPSLQTMHLHIQTNLTRGNITFLQACSDLHAQCDDARAHEVLTRGGSGTRVSRALISSTAKGKNNRSDIDSTLLCPVDACKDFRHRGLCRRHFSELGAGKVPSLTLRKSWGTVTWDGTANRPKYPSTLPADRHPIART